MIYIPVYNPSSNLTVGKYRLCFKDVKNFSVLPDVAISKKYSLLGKTLAIDKTEKDLVNNRYYLYIELITNPLPILALVYGILAIIGVGLIYMTFDKLEKVIDSPLVEIGLIIGIIIIVFALIKYVKIKK